jgi:hypothetical protein
MQKKGLTQCIQKERKQIHWHPVIADAMGKLNIIRKTFCCILLLIVNE